MLVNFRIGGAVWGERVQYEPLTDVDQLHDLGYSPTVKANASLNIMLLKSM